jgi:DNA mismatch endonuclease, patch repair protein
MPAPIPLNELVSAQMRRMPRKNTGPEMALRRELHRRGLRFRVELKDVPGSPDIAFTRARIGVFVDGCFWHACPQHGGVPKNNRLWWEHKFAGNRERDERKDKALRGIRWVPVHVWEHEDVVRAADRIEKLWRKRAPQQG